MTGTGGSPVSVLAVMQHPDDAELWAGGTLALHARDGEVLIAVTRHDDARMAEAEAGAAILGARLHVLPPPMNPHDLHDLLVSVRPEVLITHPVTDMHPGHRHAATTVLAALPDAVIATGYPRRTYTTDTYNSLTLTGPVTAPVIIDISDTYDLKTRALAAHSGTQPIGTHFGPMAQTLARLWGARIGTAYGEAFTPVPVLGCLPGSLRL
jgi:LmbE family N-acetylglucosaminyl deacetylase